MNSTQETQLGHELHQLVSGQPFTPDIEAIGLRARQRHRRGLALRGATAAGAVVLAAGGLFAAVHGTDGTAAGTHGWPGARGEFQADVPGRPHHGQKRPAAG